MPINFTSTELVTFISDISYTLHVISILLSYHSIGHVFIIISIVHHFVSIQSHQN